MASVVPAASHEITASVAQKRDELFARDENALSRKVDGIFALVMVLQLLGVLIAANLATKLGGGHSEVGTNAINLGLAIAVPVWFMTLKWPGRPSNRFIIAIAQMQMSGLLIAVTGGRLPTHFHIFGSLAFLGFYRDWRVLVPAVLVVMGNQLADANHLVSWLVFYPPQQEEQNVYYLFLEHTGWMLFASIFIGAACVQGRREMLAVAERQALLEETKDQIEQLVVERTQELRESEARKVAMLESALDGILSMDATGRLIDANLTSEEMFGAPRGGLTGTSITALLRSDNASLNAEEWLASLRASGVGVRVAAVGKGPEGEFPAELTISPVELEGVVGFTLFVRDLTEQRRLESKVAHGQKMETIGRLSTGIAHEINTPNQYIADNIRFLDQAFGSMRELVSEYRHLAIEARTGEVKPETLENLSSVEASSDVEFLLEEIPSATKAALDGVERVGNIVRAMRDFAHPGSVRRESVDVNAVVNGAVTVTRNEWKHVAELSMKLTERLPRITGHSGDLGQAVLNLIVNAAHAVSGRSETQPLGRIVVRTFSSKDHVVIEVEDDGCGIPADQISKIFDPFFTTKGVGLGTGQGLAFVHSAVVQRMNGEVDVRSEPGKGTCFVLRLPSSVKEAVN